MKSTLKCIAIVALISGRLFLWPSYAAAQNSPATLSDYVSCQFSDQDEKRWLGENSDLNAISRAVAYAASDPNLTSSVDKKVLAKAIESIRVAPSRTQLHAAILSIPNNTVTSQLEIVETNAANEAAAQKQAPIVPPSDILCSQSILSYNEASDVLGKRIANTYLAIQVVVRNLNQNSEFLMHDVLIRPPAGRFRGGHDKLIARGVAEKGQIYDPRNMIMGGLDTLSATAGAISLLNSATSLGLQSLQNGNNVLTAFLPALKKWFPDDTVNQMNRLNDLGFSASNLYKIVIPKGGSVPFITFVPQELFSTKVSNWTANDFLAIDNTLLVLVAGEHIQQVPNTTASLQQIQCPTSKGDLDLSQGSSGTFVCQLTGANLNQIQKARLKTSYAADKSADGDVKVSNQNSTSGSATFKLTDLQALTASSYDVYLELNTGDELHTGLKVTLPNPNVSVVPPQLTLAGCAGGNCPLQITGSHLSDVATLSLTEKDGDVSSLVTGSFSAASDTTGSGTFQAARLTSGKSYFLVLTSMSGTNTFAHMAISVK